MLYEGGPLISTPGGQVGRQNGRVQLALIPKTFMQPAG
jgi:hypothetical protein